MMIGQDLVDKMSWIDEKEKELVLRSYNVLMGNVYNADAGYLWSPYRCLSPGMNKFRGIWNWDSAFHAIGLARWDIELAKESILGFLVFQKKNGLLPDVIRENGSIVDDYSKPPVFAWATEMLYERGADYKFIQDVYPKLVLNVKWWETERCFNGLFHYDSSDKGDDNYDLHVRYESGWDNSVRWDTPIINYWAIDLNCFMVMNYRALGKLASILGKVADADKWMKKSEELSNKINKYMWDDEKKIYGDVNRYTQEVSSILTPASFMPLYISIADVGQAEAMRVVAENNFDCKMPTVSFDNPEYSNNYWRGSTWLNVAYFAAKGLKNYNFSVADKIKESILNMCFLNKDGIYENYDSVTLKGQYCNCFGWSSVFILEFIDNF